MNQSVRIRSASGPHAPRFTIEQFCLIADSGALDDYHRTELLDGRISVMSPQHVPHARVKMRIYDALRACVAGDASLEVLTEASIELGQRNLPQPDIFIWTPSDAQRGAPDGSVKLVVEVADSSEKHDLGAKARIYAAHGIPEYWVAVLRTRTFERFTDIANKAYARRDGFAFADGVAALTLPGVAVPAGAIA